MSTTSEESIISVCGCLQDLANNCFSKNLTSFWHAVVQTIVVVLCDTNFCSSSYTSAWWDLKILAALPVTEDSLYGVLHCFQHYGGTSTSGKGKYPTQGSWDR
jgi:hypothetical protein